MFDATAETAILINMPPGKEICYLFYEVLLQLHLLLACKSLSRVQIFVTPWTVACQVSLSMGFSRQEYLSELLCPPPGDLPDPGIKLTSLMSPALASGFFTTSATWKAHRLLGTNPITKQKYIIEKLGLEVSLFIFLPLDRKILYYFERKGKQ